MATISNPTLTVENLTATTVKVTVKYRLTPNTIEKLAGTVFSETIKLIGDDLGATTDIEITTFPVGNFAVSTATPTVDRERTKTVLKSAMNEDPEFQATGAETVDQTFARIKLSYAANPPTSQAILAPASTNHVTGAWK